ncbi:MAG: response regulator, partial [Dehalococcoidia bacterium]
MRELRHLRTQHHTHAAPSRDAAAGSAVAVCAEESAAKLLVLVVDDEPGIVEFLRFALEDNGYRVATARDGCDALAQIGRERPDFVLTDLMMPRLDGWEFCRRLRSDAQTRAVPVIGMSAVDAKQAPLDVFLKKPFELDDLLDALRR